MHEGVGGGHFSVDIISQKVFDAMTGGQLYTSMHNNTINHVMLVNEPKIFYIPQWRS
jgi:hypothetical protein